MKAVVVMVLCGVALAMARPQGLNQYDVGGVHVVDGPVSDVNVVDGPNQAPSDVNVVNGNGHPGARSARQVGPNNPNIGWEPAYLQQPGDRNPNISIEPAYVDYGNQGNNYPGHLRPGQGQVGPNNPNIGWGPAYVEPTRNPNINIDPEYVDFGNQGNNYPVNPNYPGHLRPGQSPPGARSG